MLVEVIIVINTKGVYDPNMVRPDDILCIENIELPDKNDIIELENQKCNSHYLVLEIAQENGKNFVFVELLKTA